MWFAEGAKLGDWRDTQWEHRSLEEIIDGVKGGGNSEVVVVGESDEVDGGGKEWVDNFFLGETRR